MTVEVPTNEPLEARAGLTWAWKRTDLTEFPATSWTLKYWFKKTGATGANFSITAVADGAAHSVSVSATTTGAYTAGDYAWAAEITAGSEAYEVDRGRLKVLPKYDAATNLDDRTHARKMLEALEAELEGRATAGMVALIEFTLQSRGQKNSPEILKKLRDEYRGEVAAEDAAERLRNGMGGTRLLYRL